MNKGESAPLRWGESPNRPNPLPTYRPVTQKIPGAIDVAFFDCHAELVRLERLWRLYGGADWVPPAQLPACPVG